MDALFRRALAHPMRTEILAYLMRERGGEGTDEVELADSLGLTIAGVKYHLGVLGDAELIVHVDHMQAAGKRYIAAASAGL
jgi:DNA-binding transcriptional ArsR family regulator